MVSGSISLPCSGCFSPFPHGTSSLLVSQEYLALPDGAGRFRQDFTGPALLRILLGLILDSHTGLSPTMTQLSRSFCFQSQPTLQSYNPSKTVIIEVWAIPFSLATTKGITIVFYSSRYLDVSVPWVSFPTSRNDTASRYRVVPFGNLRVKGCLHLTVAYRSLPRPSSPLRA